MMNPIFVFIVIVATVLLWFLLSFAFPMIGKFVLKIWRDTKYNIDKKEEDHNEG